MPIRFRILEGGGSLIPGEDAGDGSFTILGGDAQGNVTDANVLPSPGNSIVRIRYRKGNTNVPALVGVGPGPTDVFVLGVPQAFLVDKDGHVVRQPHAASPMDFTETDFVKIRVLTQLDKGAGPVEIKSNDACFADRGDDGVGIGQKRILFQVLSPAESPQPERFSVLESGPMLFTSELVQPGQLPTGVTIFHVFAGGGISLSAYTEALQLLTAKATLGGILPMTSASALNQISPTAKITGTVKGLDPLEGRILFFLLNGFPAGDVITDANGQAQIDILIPEGFNSVEIRDSETASVSFHIPLTRIFSGFGHHYPPVQQQGQATNTGDVENLLRQPDVEGRPTTTAGEKFDEFVGQFDWSLDATLADAVGGETRYNSTNRRFEIRVRPQGGNLAAAYRLGHEVKHVEDGIVLRREFATLISTIPAFTTAAGVGYSAREVLERAAFLLAADEFGDNTPTGDRDFTVGLKRQKEAHFLRENSAYRQGRNLLIQLRDQANINVAGIDNALLNATGEALNQEIENRVREDAVEMRRVALGIWNAQALLLRDPTRPGAIPGMLGHLDDNALVGDKIIMKEHETGLNVRKLLRLAAIRSELIPER